MKRQSKYILSVYATFSIELLFNIVTMWFCEDILCWNQITTFDGLESKLKILAMVFIPVSRGYLMRYWIKKEMIY